MRVQSLAPPATTSRRTLLAGCCTGGTPGNGGRSDVMILGTLDRRSPSCVWPPSGTYLTTRRLTSSWNSSLPRVLRSSSMQALPFGHSWRTSSQVSTPVAKMTSQRSLGKSLRRSFKMGSLSWLSLDPLLDSL